MPDQAFGGAFEKAEGVPEGGAVPAVRVEGLWKRFGQQIAVHGIDLVLPAGRFIGLVGPNGAGKTTTLSMITGLLRPDQGRILVAGNDVWADPESVARVKARIGVLPEGLRLFERLSGRELLAYTGRLRGLPGAEVDKRAAQLLDVLGLTGAQHKLVVDYSTGMRKKIGLAAALLHNPEVLFLDEPFEGVDPVSAQTIRGVLERYTASGATVVFSSHVMELVESLCDWVAVMAAGRIRAQGPLAEVRGDAPSLQAAFLELVGANEGGAAGHSLDWLGGTGTGTGTDTGTGAGTGTNAGTGTGSTGEAQ
ncbi:ABC transporter ATP-binding protein [Streptomyces cinereoruber]|uniref:ABC transporter ATP-binding protein n=1 Tax=Streptomyces cinereoruber TaxID=67260 RepID=UPI003EB9D476